LKHPFPPAALACLLSLAGASAQAQLRTLPAPGLWEHEARIMVNGQDVAAMMRQMQAEMMKNLTPEQRKQMQAQMGSSAVDRPLQECVTAEDVARFSDPKSIIADMQKQAPQCRFQPASVTASTVSFTGQCADPNGYTGDVRGDFTLVSAKEWKGTYSGQGRGPAGSVAPGAAGKAGAITMQTDVKGRWLSSSCGAVKPRPR
jgi:hypothetical protein